MRRLPIQAFLAVLTAAILLGVPTESKALCCLFDWWGAYRPTYSAYYAPTYTAGYSPYAYTAGYAPYSYTAAYAPYSYTAAYLPSTSYYAAPAYGSSSSCCASGCCGVQTSYSAPSCCSPCNSCVSCCDSNCSNCSNCPGGDCGLASSSSSDPTPATPRAGSTRQNPTFIEEEDRGTGSGYDTPVNPMNKGTEDGFSPRKPDDMMDPLDRPFGDTSVDASNTLRFKMPQSVIDGREPAPAHQPESQPTRKVNDVQAPRFPLENLDEKITSRSVSHRTRLVERRSWEQPVIAKTISREVSDQNLGWVPVPAPTQLVQK